MLNKAGGGGRRFWKLEEEEVLEAGGGRRFLKLEEKEDFVSRKGKKSFGGYVGGK